MRLPRKLLIITLSTLVPLQPLLQAASSLPTGGSFTAGSGKISASGNVLTINQNSLKGIIDWNTFSIGTGSAVNFNNGSGATLNRVSGDASTILGQLSATGTIYLLNPQGILIGHGATVHTGGDFLATTLNIPNSAFLSNAPLKFTGNSAAAVVNLGDLSSTGGSIYLIGHSVSNGGSITTPNGTTGLAAGGQVLISDSASDQRVTVLAPGGDLTNSGFISAAQAELKSNGGNIYALAGNNGGQIQATGTATRDGHVWLIATNGTANVSGLIAATNADGTGGAIETSGAHVLTNAATIKTGKNGNWLLDPDDLTIDSVLAGTIETSLNGGTNVTEQTTAGGTGGSGDITVASSIAWTGAAGLTLSAYRGIGFNPGVVISNSGSGNLTLRADNTGTGTGTINFNNSNQIDFSASTGNVSLLYNPSSYASPTDYTPNVVTNSSWTAPSNGSVTSQMTAYMLVNNASNLQNINQNESGTYALGLNIDLSSNPNFSPIGSDDLFTGIFDGQGHTINGLTINDATNGSLGLFAYNETGSQLRNVNLTNVDITETASSSGGNGLIGALTAYNRGVISNVSVAGVIHAGQLTAEVGGLAGKHRGSILNSSASVTIDASTTTSQVFAGGLVGESGGPISNSYAIGSVNAPNAAAMAYLGGLVGYGYAAISNSHATGSVTGGHDAYVGGLVGASSGAISYSYATGAATASDAATLLPAVGGLVGYNTGTISNSYATGAATGGADAQVGGIAGYSSAAIANSYATGAVTVGDTVNFTAYAGGLVGLADPGATITNSHATGAVIGGQDALVGGLAGQNSDAINTSYATGSVTCGQNCAAGGLIGLQSAPVSTSYAMGPVAVDAFSYVGGLVGLSDASLTDTYARGTVTATGSPAATGGLVGLLSGPGSITTSYSSGLVTGPPGYSGGLVGLSGGGSISSSYWDSQASGQSQAAGNVTPAGAIGLTTVQLQSGTMPAGFNTNNSVWVAPAGVYPYFGFQGPLVTISGTAYNGSSVISSAGVGVLSAGLSLATLTTNSSGFYTLSEPQNMVSSGVLSYLTGNGYANTFSDGTGSGGFTNMDLHVGTLSLLNASSTSLSGLNAALAATLGTNSGSQFLFALPGGQLSLLSGINLSIASSASSFTLDQPLSATGNILINSTGNLGIAPLKTITASAGNKITLVAGGSFANNAGASALNVTGGGKWLVYSQNPANDTTGGLAEDYIQYNATYGATAPAGSGNGFLYTLAPVITESLTGTISKTYDGTNSATIASGNFATSGVVNGDTVTFSLPASGTYSSPNAGSGLDISAPGVTIASASHGQIPVYGYQLASGSATGQVGTINPATLIYTADPSSQDFGSSNNIFTGTVTGFVAGQTLASATTGTAAFTSSTNASSPAGTYGIYGSGLTANNGNYVFTQAPANSTALTILAAATTPVPPPSPVNPPTTPATTLTIDVNNVTVTTGQTPGFSATYVGLPISGLDISSLLAGLSYQITPALSGPGTYKITATGTAPSGYALNIVAGTFTLIDNSPVTIPSLASLFKPEVPSLLLLPESGGSGDFLQPPNSLGLFQIDFKSNPGNGFGPSFTAPNWFQNALSQSVFFTSTNDKSENFVAGAKP